jgi:hypothetical protein
MKYVGDLVLLAEEETVLQGIFDSLVEIGRCCGMEENVEKTVVMLKATIPSTECDRSKTTGECGIFKLFGSMIT